MFYCVLSACNDIDYVYELLRIASNALSFLLKIRVQYRVYSTKDLDLKNYFCWIKCTETSEFRNFEIFSIRVTYDVFQNIYICIDLLRSFWKISNMMKTYWAIEHWKYYPKLLSIQYLFAFFGRMDRFSLM